MARRASSDNVVRFTPTAVSALRLKPDQKERTVWDTETPGFGCRLQGTRKTWVIRPPRLGGRSSLHTLGPVEAFTLTEARKLADERLRAARLGEDPREARRQKREAAKHTVGSALKAYVADAERRMKPSSLVNLRTHINTHWKPLHDMALASVTRADVTACIKQVAKRADGKTTPQSAIRARRNLSSFYGWCVAEGMCDANPVAGTRALADEVRRERVLSDDELRALWRACGDDDFGRIVRLLILTGARRDEVADIRWGEILPGRDVWVIPHVRTKNKLAHAVPLMPLALAVLGERGDAERALVFGSGKGGFSGFSKRKAALDRQLGFSEPWRIHDLRRTVSTGMNTLGVQPHIVEVVLNHVSGFRAGVAGTYNRASYELEKRAALSLWADHVAALVTDKEEG